MDQLTKLLTVPADVAAQRLLGCYLVRTLNGQQLIGKIVETEAYSQDDVASHSYRGVTPRTQVMFGPPGHLYVYFTYGMHYCCNVVVGPEGHGSAVLIRALEPLQGIELAANGPARLCKALTIDKSLNGQDLRQPPVELIIRPPVDITEVVQSTRIGISRGQDVPWRFYLRGSPYVSKV